MRTLDLLRNHPWNMQAVITDRTGDEVPNVRYGRNDPGFEVRIEPITRPTTGLEKTTPFATKEEAYAHAKTVLGF